MLSPKISPDIAPVASLIAFLRQLKNNPQVESAEQPGVLRYRTGIPHPWFNGVLVSRPTSRDESIFIQEQVAYFKNWGINPFTWWLEPGLSLEDWGSQLLPDGFVITNDPPGMACDLQGLPDDVPTPAGFHVQQVDTLPMLDIWGKTFVAGFDLPESFIAPYLNILAGFGMNDSLKNYLGYLHGEPVAAASIFFSDGIAGIYNVAVVGHARRKGLGAAITLVPLLEARDQGYTIGALQSSEMGFKVYQRLGFQKVCDVTHFYYSA